MELHHIGIACDNIKNTKEYLHRLFDVTEESEEIFDDQQNAYLCMVKLYDGTNLELVSGKIVEKLVKKRHFLYHTCFQTEDIEKKIEEFENLGAKLISEPKPAKLFHGRKVAFLMTQFGLLELLDSQGGIE